MVLAFVWKIYFQREEYDLKQADGYVTTHVNASKAAVEALKAALTQLELEVADARTKMDTLQRQISELRADNDAERGRRLVAEQTAIEARREVDALREQLNRLSGGALT